MNHAISLRVLVAAVVFAGAAGCGQAQTWKRIDADGKFTFQVPVELMQEDVEGVGTYIQRFRSDDMLLSFEYEGPKNDLCDTTLLVKRAENSSEALQIGGRIAQIILFHEPKPGMDADLEYHAVVCIPDASPAGMQLQRMTLVMWARCRSPQQQAAAKQIFQSIQFLRR